MMTSTVSGCSARNAQSCSSRPLPRVSLLVVKWTLAGNYRDKALMNNDYAADGYARDMELEHIYAEAEKRLK